jgi:hypothetical protein
MRLSPRLQRVVARQAIPVPLRGRWSRHALLRCLHNTAFSCEGPINDARAVRHVATAE